MQLDTHICLVSGQPLPNLIPAFDPALKPRRMILVVSPNMQQQAHWLQTLLRPRGIEVEQWPVEDAWDLEHLQLRLLELLERENAAVRQKRIGLNVTGGTKLMSIAAHEACRDEKLAVFYVHPETDRVVWLHPAGLGAHELADRIGIEDFLQSHGVRVTTAPGRNIPDPALTEVGHEIISQIEGYTRPLGTLNWLAQTARKNLRSETIGKADEPLQSLIELFASHGFLQWQQNRLHFRDEAARFFVNGGWLEYLVFDAVRRIREQDEHIHDIARSVAVSRQQGTKSIPNELDVAFLRNNRLHLIECKTRQFKGAGEDSAGAETLYKLDTLAELTGGLQARAMLVSYRDVAGHDRTRAGDLRIRVCSGAQLRHLQQHLQKFILH